MSACIVTPPPTVQQKKSIGFWRGRGRLKYKDGCWPQIIWKTSREVFCPDRGINRMFTRFFCTLFWFFFYTKGKQIISIIKWSEIVFLGHFYIKGWGSCGRSSAFFLLSRHTRHTLLLAPKNSLLPHSSEAPYQNGERESRKVAVILAQLHLHAKYIWECLFCIYIKGEIIREEVHMCITFIIP